MRHGLHVEHRARPRERSGRARQPRPSPGEYPLIASSAVGAVALASSVALYLASRDTAQPIAVAPTHGGALIVGGFSF